jgi:hypothetical protein
VWLLNAPRKVREFLDGDQPCRTTARPHDRYQQGPLAVGFELVTCHVPSSPAWVASMQN